MVLSFLVVLGCAEPDVVPPAEPASWAATAVEETVERVAGDCAGAEGCVRFVATFPRFAADSTGADSTDAADSRRLMDLEIARLLSKAPLSAGPSDEPAKNLGDQADRWIGAWRTALHEVPEAGPQRWLIDKRVDVIHEAPMILSLRATELRSTGGAHPNAWSAYVSFDRSQGRPWRLEHLLIDGFEAPLRARFEARFRTEREMSPEQSFRSVGFTLEDDRLRLPEQWAIVEDGLLFFFNAYDIGPYALGPTEVRVEREALSDLVAPDGPLAAWAAVED
ncbi:MAG: RsiV family protein [Acidobacteriota bacterium]